jgi:hypothetical protein
VGHDRPLKHQSNPLTRRLGPSVRTNQSHETGHGFGSWNHSEQRDVKRRGTNRERVEAHLDSLGDAGERRVEVGMRMGAERVEAPLEGLHLLRPRGDSQEPCRRAVLF